MRLRKRTFFVAAVTFFFVVGVLVVTFVATPYRAPPLRVGMHKDEVDQMLGKPAIRIDLGRPLDERDGEALWVYEQGLPHAGRRVFVECDGNDCVISWTTERDALNPYVLYEKVRDVENR